MKKIFVPIKEPYTILSSSRDHRDQTDAWGTREHAAPLEWMVYQGRRDSRDRRVSVHITVVGTDVWSPLLDNVTNIKLTLLLTGRFFSQKGYNTIIYHKYDYSYLAFVLI